MRCFKRRDTLGVGDIISCGVPTTLDSGQSFIRQAVLGNKAEEVISVTVVSVPGSSLDQLGLKFAEMGQVCISYQMLLHSRRNAAMEKCGCFNRVYNIGLGIS